MTFTISLRNGKLVLFDHRDAELVLAHAGRWTYSFNPKTNRYGYCVRYKSVKNKTRVFFMHREIMDAKPGQIVDHINGNGLDNRRANLRFVSASQNALNQRRKANRSGMPIGIRRSWSKFQARVCLNGKRVSLGAFDSIEEAVKVREQFLKEKNP